MLLTLAVCLWGCGNPASGVRESYTEASEEGSGEAGSADSEAGSDADSEAGSDADSAAGSSADSVAGSSADNDAGSSADSAAGSSDEGSEVLSETGAVIVPHGSLYPEGFDYSEVPEYSGKKYVIINDGRPFFSDEDITLKSFEYYSSLDELGRCGTAYANICPELMPTEKRGDISEIHPTGWVQNRYDGIVDADPPYLYNRSHLIAYKLAGENANIYNLITGTRYFNAEGMSYVEDKVADYVRNTGNHVLYRVTPVFEGDDLLSRGVLMEAQSVEDDRISYCEFIYNVQPGIYLDYSDGYNKKDR
ncbi:MAG: DNA/RNA non-specific endonuclease [Lachnospiraceae bacterium]|nr:DNA/RNA non-specific endonuclease [Lachnospiraceae bacterium]